MSSDFLDRYLEAKEDGAREILNELHTWLRNETRKYPYDGLNLRLARVFKEKIEEELTKL